ncbi:hypothetical protein D623_10008258 [Myotis brandtii]|uniref:Uncharacterized protein n=1 Tax=Myotis brandtii TaxID=109478 RepID=S7Q7T7_MYOBR|nr:hypothetical protein D623_10008258 [Myotis brandtii]
MEPTTPESNRDLLAHRSMLKPLSHTGRAPHAGLISPSRNSYSEESSSEQVWKRGHRAQLRSRQRGLNAMRAQSSELPAARVHSPRGSIWRSLLAGLGDLSQLGVFRIKRNKLKVKHSVRSDRRALPPKH